MKSLNTTNRSRREMLEEFVLKNPGDAFARYALALECAQAGESDLAAAHFRALLNSHPDYVAGYFHFGQLLAQRGEQAEAQRILSRGVEAARKAGNAHAQSEMEEALRSLAPATGGPE
jgi:tetratricopeptide (TPR) repeat protein